MMIFKSKNNAGNMMMAVVLGILGVSTATLLAKLGLNNYRQSLRSNQESSAMLYAQSVAALFKQDILRNYEAYADTNNNKWDPCRGVGATQRAISIPEFINILNDPDQYSGCGAVRLTFRYFSTIPTSDRPDSATSIELRRLKNTNAGVDSFPQFSPDSVATKMVQFKTNLRVSSVNTDPNRNLIEGIIELSNNSTNFLINKKIRMAIDIKRAIQMAANNPLVKLCRDVAGAVCEVTGLLPQLDFTFLDSSGQIMKVEAGRTITPYGLSVSSTKVSVKNLMNNPVTEYDVNSHCLASGPRAPLPWVLDAASDNFNNSYYLTVHGMLIDSMGNNLWAVNDPKFVSIAFDNRNWLLLRSDGAVFSTPNIRTLVNLQEISTIPRLPSAVAITTGKGPLPCF